MMVSRFVFLPRMTQPIFLGGLIRYFSPGSSVDRDTAYLYAAGVVVCSLFNIFCKNPIWLALYHTCMKMRVGTCSLIYRKVNLIQKSEIKSLWFVSCCHCLVSFSDTLYTLLLCIMIPMSLLDHCVSSQCTSIWHFCKFLNNFLIFILSSSSPVGCH
jgi:hypothetical protein